MFMISTEIANGTLLDLNPQQTENQSALAIGHKKKM